MVRDASPTRKSGRRNQSEVALRLPVANQEGSARRTLRANTPYYTRLVNRHKKLVLSNKPDALRHLDKLQEKVWKQFQTHLKRERTPLEEANFYALQMESRGLKSVASLARVLKQSTKRVLRHLRLLKLPEPIRKFLAEHRTPDYIRYFSERKLQEFVRLDARSAWRRFLSATEEAQREAGIWKSEAQ